MVKVVFVGCGVIDWGISSLPIGEIFDVLDYGVRAFDSGSPFLAVEQVVLHGRPGRFHHGVIQPVTSARAMATVQLRVFSEGIPKT